MATPVEITEVDASKYIDAAGVRIHYNEARTGEPLVAIHHWIENRPDRPNG